MLRQQRLGLAVVARLLVMALAQADDLNLGKQILEQMQEAHLALLMGAVAQAAGDHRDLGGLATDEACQQVAGRASRRAIVEPDISDAPGVGDVGDQGHRRHAPIRQPVDRLSHRRMLQRHEGDAVDVSPDPPEMLGQQFRLEALDIVAATTSPSSVDCCGGRWTTARCSPSARAASPRRWPPHGWARGGATIGRLVVAGGDTSSLAVKSLDIWGLSYRAALVPGAPLCRTHSDDPRLDGLDIVLKGGQMGPVGFFDAVATS